MIKGSFSKKMLFFIIYSIQNIENVKIFSPYNLISLQRMSHCLSLRVGLHEMGCKGKTIEDKRFISKHVVLHSLKYNK